MNTPNFPPPQSKQDSINELRTHSERAHKEFVKGREFMERRQKEIQLMEIGAKELPLNAYLVEMAKADLRHKEKDMEMKKQLLELGDHILKTMERDMPPGAQ